MSDNNVTDMLKEALAKSYEEGYAKGRVHVLKALSDSMHFVYDMGVLSDEEKKGYKITLDTVDATLKFIKQDNEESGL
jgi:hypothetical protein